MNTKLARMAAFRITLLIAGIICLATIPLHQPSFYLYVRILQFVQFFGGAIFIVLSSVMKNQEEIIRLLYERRNDSDNA